MPADFRTFFEDKMCHLRGSGTCCNQVCIIQFNLKTLGLMSNGLDEIPFLPLLWQHLVFDNNNKYLLGLLCTLAFQFCAVLTILASERYFIQPKNYLLFRFRNKSRGKIPQPYLVMTVPRGKVECWATGQQKDPVQSPMRRRRFLFNLIHCIAWFNR